MAPRTEKPIPAAISVRKLAQKRTFSFLPEAEFVGDESIGVVMGGKGSDSMGVKYRRIRASDDATMECHMIYGKYGFCENPISHFLLK